MKLHLVNDFSKVATSENLHKTFPSSIASDLEKSVFHRSGLT